MAEAGIRRLIRLSAGLENVDEILEDREMRFPASERGNRGGKDPGSESPGIQIVYTACRRSTGRSGADDRGPGFERPTYKGGKEIMRL
jgi:hypothetical protein